MAYASLDDINKILILRKDPAGKYYIGGINVPNVLCTQVQTSGTVIKDTVIMSGNTSARLLVGNGTLDAPALAFASEPSLGLFRSAPRTVSIVSGGVRAMDITDAGVAFNVPVTFSGGSMPSLNVDTITSNGDLSINPAGANVDFNGKNLLNIGGIATNQYKYTAAGLPVSTADDTPTAVYSLGIDTNTVMYFTYTVMGANVTTGAALIYSSEMHVTNIADIVTINYQWVTKRSGALTGQVSVDAAVDGTSIAFTVIGQPGTNMKWIITFDINKLPL